MLYITWDEINKLQKAFNFLLLLINTLQYHFKIFSSKYLKDREVAYKQSKANFRIDMSVIYAHMYNAYRCILDTKC